MTTDFTVSDRSNLAGLADLADLVDLVDLVDLALVTGGTTASASAWAQVREQAAPHCPSTVARFTKMPTSRAQAQAIGSSCLAEMGSFKAAFGGTTAIRDGIDAAFPRT